MRMLAIGIRWLRLFGWLAFLLVWQARAVADTQMADTQVADIQVDGAFTQASLGTHWRFYEDASLRRDLDDLPAPEQWSVSTQSVPNLGFSDSAFWFRTRISSTLLWRQMLYLQIANPTLSEVDVYWIPEHEPTRWYQAGLRYPFSSRVIPHRLLLFPLQLPAKGVGELIVRVRSQASVQVPATLLMPAALMSVQEETALWIGVALGVPAIMLCYNLLLFWMVRERNYLYFTLHALTILLFLLVWQGFSAQYFLPENIHWRSHELAVTALLATFFSNLFSENYLGLRRRRFFLLTIYRSIRFLCGALLLVLWFLPEGVSNVIAMLLASASAVCVSMAVVASFRSGGRTVRIFCVAWMILVVGVILLALSKMGFVAAEPLTEQGLLAAVALEVSMIAYALADRLNAERYLKLHAQETALRHAEREKVARLHALAEEREAQRALADAVELQRTLHQSLEQQVQERTQALELAHQRLLALYDEDPLTGLKNRRYFSERLTEECKRARQLQQSMAVLLIDMDHFKQINDTWGHLLGDQCIRHLAGILAACFNRAGDCVARYGGEEFAVLMSHCDTGTGQWVAENLRHKVEQMPALTAEASIPLRVSIGVAIFVADEKHDVDQYLQLADEALYHAKSSGRNCVNLVVAGMPVIT